MSVKSRVRLLTRIVDILLGVFLDVVTLRDIALEHMRKLVVERQILLSVRVAVATVECIIVLRLKAACLLELV